MNSKQPIKEQFDSSITLYTITDITP